MNGLKWRHGIAKAKRAGFFHWQFLDSCSDKSHEGAMGKGNWKRMLGVGGGGNILLWKQTKALSESPVQLPFLGHLLFEQG